MEGEYLIKNLCDVIDQQKDSLLRCAKCAGSVLASDAYFVLDRPFHRLCLTCSECYVILDVLGRAYVAHTEDGELLMCRDHYMAFTRGACARCDSPFDGTEDEIRRLENYAYHSPCYQCMRCRLMLGPNNARVILDGRLLCHSCHWNRFIELAGEKCRAFQLAPFKCRRL